MAHRKQLNRRTAGTQTATDLIENHWPVTPIGGTGIEIHQDITQFTVHHALPAASSIARNSFFITLPAPLRGNLSDTLTCLGIL